MTGRARSPDGGGTVGGTLYVVATPIGNLADITPRALDVLRAVPLIAAEDTRLTRRLLDRHAIDVPLTSYHAKRPGRTAALLGHLRGGVDLALVSDAGTPVVSDPGGELVTAWAGEGAWSSRCRDRRPWSRPWPCRASRARTGRSKGSCHARARAAGATRPHCRRPTRRAVVFEAPNRVAGTLHDLATVCGPDRPAAVCRELTKLHETVSGARSASCGGGRSGAIRRAVSSCSSSVRGPAQARRPAKPTARRRWTLPVRRSSGSSPTGWRDRMPRDAWRRRLDCRDARCTGPHRTEFRNLAATTLRMGSSRASP